MTVLYDKVLVDRFFLAQLTSQPPELFIYFEQNLPVGLSVILKGVTNRNRCRQRLEILHTGTYW